jgi:hypothetical protein
MPGLNDLRALLHDRQVKEGALGSTEYTICLDPQAVEDYNALEAELTEANAVAAPDKATLRLAGPLPEGEADTTSLQAQVEEAKQRVKDTTLVLVFRALSSVQYQAVLANHPDANDDELNPFLVELCSLCFREVRTFDGEKLDIPWEEIQGNITYGEWEPLGLQVLAINRRRVDVPFSLKPSRKTR